MNEERINSYKSEITQWISKQGFLFQLFKAPRLLGSSAGVGAYLAGLFFKLFVIVLIVALGFLFLTATSHQKPKFTEKIKSQISDSLSAETVEMSDLKGGFFSNTTIPEIEVVGSEESFFEDLRLQNVDMDLGNLAARKNVLQSTKISCASLETKIKISSGEKKGDESIFSPLFANDEWFRFNHLKARSFDCTWGYSEKTAGFIEGATMDMTRNSTSWVVEITGGTLNYSWLKDVQIEKMKLLIKKDHFEIAEGLFSKNGAQFTLDLKVDQFGVNPIVSGGGNIKNCRVEDLFNPTYTELISGIVNAEYTLSGSPNSPKGLSYTFIPLVTDSKEKGVTAKVHHKNSFKLKHAIPIWRAMTTLDSSVNGYTAYTFDETNWELELTGDQIFLSNGSLAQKQDNKIKLQLSFAIKEPSEQYIENATNVSDAELKSLLMRSGMKDKAREILRLKGNINAGNMGNFDQLDRRDYAKLLRDERHFEGEAILKLHAQSFPGKDRLQAAYPPKGTQQLREVPVKLVGPVGDVTRGTTEKLYSLGKKE